MILLGSKVRCRLTGFTGMVDSRATYLYGCDRYCVQPRVGEDGKMPDSQMIDEPLLEVLEAPTIAGQPAPPPAFALGSAVRDPIRDMVGTATGRAVYLNGCARVLIEPKQTKSWWADEQQLIVLVKPPAAPVPEARKTGGPARASSRY